MTPSIGRIVHYALKEGDAPNPEARGVRPAIITGINDDHPDSVSLTVFLHPSDGLHNGAPLVAVREAARYPAAVDTETNQAIYQDGEWFWPPRS